MEVGDTTMTGSGAQVRVVLNGEPRELPEGTTIARLLEQLGRHPRADTVEHNGAILPRASYADTVLAEGDRLEVVHFVQGGGGERR